MALRNEGKNGRTIQLGLVVFRDDHSEPPFRKAHLFPIAEELVDEVESDESEVDDADGVDVGMQVMGSCLYKQSQVAVKHLRNLMGTKIFSNPKDHEVIARLIRYCTKSDDLILDSFAGSGTTAHAVLELNKEDGGNRKFILVQMPYDTKENEKEKFNICQKITAERVRRVMHGYSYATQKGKKEKVEGFGGSFTYARVGNPLFGEYRDFGKKLPAYEELAKYIFYTETSRDFDLKAMNEKTGKIGEHSGTSYYLLYTPNDNEDRQLDLPWLETLQNTDNNRKVVVYCEKIHVHRDDLTKYEQETKRTVRPMVVPYNLK